MIGYLANQNQSIWNYPVKSKLLREKECNCKFLAKKDSR